MLALSDTRNLCLLFPQRQRFFRKDNGIKVDNVADQLSRLLVKEPSEGDFDENDDKAYIHAICESVAVDIYEVRKTLEVDSVLVVIKETIRTEN